MHIYISIYIAPLYHDFILAYNIQKTRVSIGGRGRGEVFKGNPSAPTGCIMSPIKITTHVEIPQK